METVAFAMELQYLEGRWEKVARAIADHYPLPAKPRFWILDVGKAFFSMILK